MLRLFLVLCAFAPAGNAFSLEFVLQAPSAEKITFRDTGKTQIEHTFEPGEDWSGTLTIHGLSKTPKLEAELQTETSLIMSNEGPSLALTEWRHGVSPWQPLPRKSAFEFILPAPSVAEGRKFPAFDRNAFLAAVAKAQKKTRETHWRKLAEACKTPMTDPCSIAISKVTVRIYEVAGNSRTLWRELILKPALGC